jgi:putative phosphoribosyl transferase
VQPVFKNRADAGQKLAEHLSQISEYWETARYPWLVIALPRGGVPVAYEVASKLGLPLDVMIVRKVGFPGNPEFAMGAIASGDIEIVNSFVMRE